MLLCQILTAWGFDCPPDSNVVAAGQAVLDAYDTQGTPTFETPREKEALFADLATLRARLNMPENDLLLDMTASLLKMISDLEDALS